MPLSLIGTFAVLYELGYSLDNLSLMALSIAVGFVVDDAVVVIENIVRHLEEGAVAVASRAQGCRRDRLHHRFDHALAHRGLHSAVPDERLCRAAVPRIRRHRQRGSRPLAADLADAHADDVRAAAQAGSASSMGGSTVSLERGFDGLLNLYESGLKIVLRHRFMTLMVMLGTIVLTGYLYIVIPKGFFPQQDTGLIIGLSEAAQDISYSAMAERQHGRDQRSAGGSRGRVCRLRNRCRRRHHHDQQRPHVHRAQAEQRSATPRRTRWSGGCRRSLARIQGITLYMQAAQDITIGGRLSKTQYQYTLADADPGELNHWAALFLDKIKAIPGITDITTDQENAGPLLDITVNREVASSFGILPATVDNTLDDAFGQRIVSTMYTMNNEYHVVLEVDPKFQFGPEALNNIYVNSSTGQQVPLRTLINSGVKVAPLVVNHQGQFPSVTISFNLAPGNSIGQAVSAIQQVEKELGKPASLATSFQGNAQAFQSSLSSTPLLIAAALVVIYLILGMLYESVIHPITILSTLPSAGLGALVAAHGVSLRPERDRDRRHHPADRHRQEERNHADRFCAERRARTRPDLRRGDLPSLRAAFPAHPHDHHGGDARRQCR